MKTEHGGGDTNEMTSASESRSSAEHRLPLAVQPRDVSVETSSTKRHRQQQEGGPEKPAAAGREEFEAQENRKSCRTRRCRSSAHRPPCRPAASEVPARRGDGRPSDPLSSRPASYFLPTAQSEDADLTYITPSEIAGVAMRNSPIVLVERCLNSGPAVTTSMSPSSFAM